MLTRRSAEWRHTPVAIKILYEDAQSQDMELFEREVKMMATLHHPNIVQFFGYTRTHIQSASPLGRFFSFLFVEIFFLRALVNKRLRAKNECAVCRIQTSFHDGVAGETGARTTEVSSLERERKRAWVKAARERGLRARARIAAR